METVYVTKWVIARGIIVAQGEYYRIVAKQTRNLWRVFFRGHHNSPIYLTLGQEAFLTKKEAEENAANRFQRHLWDCQSALEAAQEGCVLLNRGELLTHKDPEDLILVHAFGRPLLPRG